MRSLMRYLIFSIMLIGDDAVQKMCLPYSLRISSERPVEPQANINRNHCGVIDGGFFDSQLNASHGLENVEQVGRDVYNQKLFFSCRKNQRYRDDGACQAGINQPSELLEGQQRSATRKDRAI